MRSRAARSATSPKADGRDELLCAFDEIRAQRCYVSASLRQPLAAYREAHRAGRMHAPRLTRRQRQVLELLSQGLGNAQNAARLGLAESTVKNHVSTLFALLAVDNRAGCTREALRRGLVE